MCEGRVRSNHRAGDLYSARHHLKSAISSAHTERLNRKKWKTRIELANAIFDYLEIFHNRQRRRSSIGMLTPIEYEMLHQQQPVA